MGAAMGVALGVAVGVEVEVGVGVAVGVAVAVGAVLVAVGVGVGVEVGVAVGTEPCKVTTTATQSLPGALNQVACTVVVELRIWYADPLAFAGAARSHRAGSQFGEAAGRRSGKAACVALFRCRD